MLIELLSTSNYVSYNIKIAQLFGLHTAIYLSELMNINDKAIRKNKITNNAFKIDRKYITSRTTIPKDEQLDIEENLFKLGILETGEDENVISLNITTLTTLLMSTDESLIDKVKKISKRKREKPTKQDVIKDNLKSYINANNEELKQAYESWIDSVFDKQGWMSKKAVTMAQQTVDEFSNHNLDVALKVIEIADLNAYRDMHWAIEVYNKHYKVNYKMSNPKPTKPAELSQEVF